MTKKEVIENHRKMWNWIADESLRQKRRVGKHEYLETIGISIFEKPMYNCYCCEYSRMNCEYCPVVWINENGVEHEKQCLDFDGAYVKWHYSENYKEAAKYARFIANLPERKE